MMKRLTRKEFLRSSATAAAAGVVSASCRSTWTKPIGANEDIRMAVIGFHSKGKTHIEGFRNLPGVRVVALCDVDSAVVDEEVAKFKKRNEKVETYTDVRKLLDNKDIDAVAIATPNHWHSLIAIWACQAGKDVYVEKPIAHCIWEGRQLINASHKYKRIVQSGTQNRSDIGLRKLFPWLAAGNLGKIKMVRGFCQKGRTGIGCRTTPLVPPSTVDYNLWLGPAQDEPIYRDKLHYDWHWSWNTGNGDIGNQGPHELDLIHWAHGDGPLPTRVVSFGGRFVWNDAGQTPNTQFVAFDWGDIPVYFEVRDVQVRPGVSSAMNYKGTRNGIAIFCEDGYFVGGRGGGWIYDNNNKKVKHFIGDGGEDHRANFIRAMRSRDESELRAPLRLGQAGATLAHMANTSYRLGRYASPGQLREIMSDDKEALDAIERFSAHMAEWKVDFGKTPWTAGVSLGFDSKTERFVGKGPHVKKANAMVKYNYRKPFVVPEI